MILYGEVNYNDENNYDNEPKVYIDYDFIDYEYPKNTLQALQAHQNYIADLMYQYPQTNLTQMQLGIPMMGNNPVYINDNHSIASLHDLKREQELNALKTKNNRVYVPEKSPKERIDYINKTGNVKDFAIPQQPIQDIVMKAQPKSAKNYEAIANMFYPDMDNKSQIKVSKKQISQPKVQQTQNKFYPTLADRDYIVKPLHKVLNNSIKFINNNTFLNKIFYHLAAYVINHHYEYLKPIASSFGLDTAENLDMALAHHHLDTPFAKLHTVLESYKELPIILQDKMKNKIYNQLKDILGENCINTTRGIFFNYDSEPSKRLAEDYDIKQHILRNIRQLKEYGHIKQEFKGFENTNFKYALNKADIFDLHINENREIEFFVLDIYDFDQKTDFLSKAGRANQDEEKIIPYFLVYAVRINVNNLI